MFNTNNNNPYQFNSMPSAVQPYGYAMTPQYPNVPQTAQINTNKIFVSGIEEVKMKMLPPNSEWIYLDNDKSILYQKVVDSSGHFEVKAFDIVEHTEQSSTLQDTEYVSKKEFEKLQAEFSALRDKMRGNYGRGNQEASSTNRSTEERK